MVQSKEPWYAAGLKFVCTGCGACCTGSGRVWLHDREITDIAEKLDLPVTQFVDESITRLEGRWALKENPQNGDCCFLKEGRCLIYHARPRQCRTFPWWPSTLQSEERWQEAKRICEGIEGEEAELVPLNEIQSQLAEEQRGRREWKR